MATKFKTLPGDPNLRDLQEFVKSYGFEFLRNTKGSHEEWGNPHTGVKTTLCCNAKPGTVHSIGADIKESEKRRLCEIKSIRRLRQRRLDRAVQRRSQEWRENIQTMLKFECNGSLKKFAVKMKSDPPPMPCVKLDANGWPMDDPKRLKHSPKLGPLPRHQLN